MRKAHDAAIQKERNKYLDVMAKTYSQADVESLQRQHEWVKPLFKVSYCQFAPLLYST